MASKTYNNKKTYVCHKCNQVFEAEDSLTLVCPKCGSDNIDEKTRRKNQLIPKLCVFLLTMAIGYFVTPILQQQLKSQQNVEVSSQLVVLTENETIEPSVFDSLAIVDTVEVEEVVEIPIKLECTSPIDPEKRYVYSFRASCNYEGKSIVQYHLLKSPESEEPIKISEDGQFDDVPPAENPEAFYWVCAVVKEENRTSDTVRVEGCIKRPIEKVRKITESEVADMLNKRIATQNKTYFSHPVKVDVVGNKVYSTISDFESFLKLKNKQVKDLHVEYGSNNKVIHIKVEVIDN